MAYINQPPELRVLFSDLDQRLRKLELAQRFTAPNVDFNTSTPTNPRIGDIFYDTNADLLKYWDGSNWYEIADNHLGTTVIPYTPTWTGTGLTYTGTPATGYYQKIGKLIHFTIYVACTNVTNFGTGQYSITLPNGYPSGYHYLLTGGIHRASTGAHYNLEMDLEPGTTTQTMYHPTANGGMDIFSHNKPINLATGDYWYVGGNYFIA